MHFHFFIFPSAISFFFFSFSLFITSFFYYELLSAYSYNLLCFLDITILPSSSYSAFRSFFIFKFLSFFYFYTYSSSSESSPSLLESASPFCTTYLLYYTLFSLATAAYYGLAPFCALSSFFGGSTISNSSSSDKSSISSPFKAWISLSLVGKYPSLASSTNGDRWGGGAIPGLYWWVGSKCRLLSESTIHYGCTYSLLADDLPTIGLSMTWWVTFKAWCFSSSSVTIMPPNESTKYYKQYTGVSLFN